MSKIAPIGTAYIISVSILYLMGYWGAFNVNFLEYVSIAEVAAVALKSLVTSFGYMLLGYFVAQVYMGSILKVGSGRDTSEGRFLNKYWKWIAVPLTLLATYAIFTDNPVGTFLYAIIFGPIMGVWLANQGVLGNVIENNELRYSVIMISVLILFMSHFSGNFDASKAKKNHNENQVIINNIQYTYIGKLGSSLFLYEHNKLIVKQITPIPKIIDRIPNKIVSQKL